MEALSHIAAIIPLAAEAAEESGGGKFLVTPGLGLMIWTLAIFLFEIGLVATLQAFIFAILSSIYLGDATADHH